MTRLACRVLLLVSLGALVALPTLLAAGAPVVESGDGDAAPVVADSGDNDDDAQSVDASTTTEGSITVQNITDKNGDLVGYFIDEANESSDDKNVFTSFIDWIVEKMPFVGGDDDDDDEHKHKDEMDGSGSQPDDEDAGYVHILPVDDSAVDGQQHHNGGGRGDHSGGEQHDGSPREHHNGEQHHDLPTANGTHGAPPHAGNSSIPRPNGPHGGPPSGSQVRPLIGANPGGKMRDTPATTTTEASSVDEE